MSFFNRARAIGSKLWNGIKTPFVAADAAKQFAGQDKPEGKKKIATTSHDWRWWKNWKPNFKLDAAIRIIEADRVARRWFSEMYNVKTSPMLTPSALPRRHRGHRHNLRFGRIERRAKLKCRAAPLLSA